MFPDKPHHLQHTVYLLFNVFFVLLAADDKSFRNDVIHRHAGIQGSNRILENHLDFIGKLALSRSGALPFFMILLG